MAKKDPDQIATNPPEELGKEEQRPKLKTAEERTATTSRAMQAFREEEGVDEKGERGRILLPLTDIQFGEDCQTQSPHIEETEVDCRKSKEAHQQQPDAQPLHPLTLLCVTLYSARLFSSVMFLSLLSRLSLAFFFFFFLCLGFWLSYPCSRPADNRPVLLTAGPITIHFVFSATSCGCCCSKWAIKRPEKAEESYRMHKQGTTLATCWQRLQLREISCLASTQFSSKHLFYCFLE